MIERHFVDIGSRRVHYRTVGAGPPLLMVHQSPASSAEMEALAERWAGTHLCILPDTAGFGQSDPLPIDNPSVNDFADALVAFLDAVGLAKVAGYGFHSGAIILVTAAKRHPAHFSAIAANGYAVWTKDEQTDFAANYLPPFEPQPFGEHLTWLWSRLEEQRWFFPWHRVAPETRMALPPSPLDRLQAQAMDFLHSGGAYRAGYGAVLRADRTLSASEVTPPTLVMAAKGDPLHAHLSRIGERPANWTVTGFEALADAEAAALDHIDRFPAPAARPRSNVEDAGFVRIAAAGFNGLIHWSGDRAPGNLVLPAPGSSARARAASHPDGLAIDLPGHGLSDPLPDQAMTLTDWCAVVAAIAEAIGPVHTLTGDGLSAILAVAAAGHIPGLQRVETHDAHVPLDVTGWKQLLPATTPEVGGYHLLRAWRAARLSRFYWPWFDPRPETAIPFDPADVAPARLRQIHLALMQATGGPQLLAALLAADRDVLAARCPVPIDWKVADWATARADLWHPA